jgi:hypothetical protein
MSRVTYPHLGTLYITSEHFFRALGLVPVTPPFPSRRTLDLGVNHCPEMTCAPCKILFGNYYEGLELGADRLVLFGGPDTCRLGYLARPQAERLRDAGFQFTPHTLSLRGIAADILRVARELADPSPLELLEVARTLLASLSLVDEIEQESLRLRPRERETGSATQLRQEALAAVRASQGRTELQAPRDNGRCVFRIALVGDAYSISEPFFNMNLEQRLGYMGVEVERWFWLSKSLRFPVLERVRHRHYEVMGAIGAAMLAHEYMSHHGGDTCFKGFVAGEMDNATRSFECQGCFNLCEVVEIRVGHEMLGRWDGRCGTWDM